jgi:outer membrane protein assembly factor BamB
MFKYSGGQLAHTATVAQSPNGKAPDNSMPGGILSLSANPQGKDAILWGTVAKDCTQPAPDNANCDQYANGPAEGAIDASIPGRLVAFDANTLDELWSDPDLGYFAKFNPATIADGKVFAPNFGSLADDCGGNYNAYPRKPQKACGKVRVYGLRRTNIRIPVELIRWPYFWIDPGPLAPGAVRRGD